MNQVFFYFCDYNTSVYLYSTVDEDMIYNTQRNINICIKGQFKKKKLNRHNDQNRRTHIRQLAEIIREQKKDVWVLEI